MAEIQIEYPQFMLEEYRVPSITGYNRLEPGQRTKNFDRSLRAEVRDALWMLSRQWQFGEFQGDDAASPATAQIAAEHTLIDRLSFAPGKVFAYDQDIPLETKVQREKPTANLFLSVQMARYFLKVMRANGLSDWLVKLMTRYPLKYSIDNSNRDFAVDKNDSEGIQLLNAVKGKTFDGFLLHQDVVRANGASTEFENWMNVEGADPDLSKRIAEEFENWFQRNYSQPVGAFDSCWLPSQLEYQFAVASPQAQGHQKTLVADQYSGGHLDWYSFDLNLTRLLSMDPGPDGNHAVKENYASFIPAPVSFKGMPCPRFWMMEENQTDFGKIDTSPTGLLHLLLAEFGLIYSNDWFMLPYPLAINNVCEVKNIVITDVFGQHILIRPAGRGPESDWQRWAMFHHTDKSDVKANTNLFYLTPALTKTIEGDPLEQVSFLRDEMANMVWAVEAIVPSQVGKGANGNEMALKEDTALDFVPVNDTVQIRYELGTSVPANWIPFIPVHMPGSNSEIRLQRAQMPGAKGASGVLLRENPAPYFVNEEEVMRAGIIVQRSFYRTRWLMGRSYLWSGRVKQAGKGDGWSNLKFDQIQNIKTNEVP